MRWSPNSQFIMISNGTSPGPNNLTIIDIINNKTVGSYKVFNGTGNWAPDSKSILVAPSKPLGFSREST